MFKSGIGNFLILLFFLVSLSIALIEVFFFKLIKVGGAWVWIFPICSKLLNGYLLALCSATSTVHVATLCAFFRIIFFLLSVWCSLEKKNVYDLSCIYLQHIMLLLFMVKTNGQISKNINVCVDSREKIKHS